MTSRLTECVVDCADPAALARFWAAVLDYVVVDEQVQPGEQGEPVELVELVEIAPAALSDQQQVDAIRSGPIVPTLLFLRVPEGKTVKNRLHLDVSPVDSDQAGEVARLERLGARRTDLAPPGASWVVMHDPEGNEFCVLRSLAPGHFSP
ncbi:VOC family protein [Nocardioides sp. SYSU DS0651]|uniref:VOC family protein n=1 Tax=Nocardioides sp. SYSU DS0651 TaxID=3415955 RepID=UPI003F4C192C